MWMRCGVQYFQLRALIALQPWLTQTMGTKCQKCKHESLNSLCESIIYSKAYHVICPGSDSCHYKLVPRGQGWQGSALALIHTVRLFRRYDILQKLSSEQVLHYAVITVWVWRRIHCNQVRLQKWISKSGQPGVCEAVQSMYYCTRRECSSYTSLERK